jgi:4-hydroxybenzoate polyprenyltransferase
MVRLRDYVELSRISNLPTCWSNVLTGAAIGAAGSTMEWGQVLCAALAISAMYVAGMAINDAADAPADASARPERPIPSGRISRRAAWIYGFACTALGLGLAAALGAQTLGLAVALGACIVVYDLLHRRIEGSVVLMGACRGFVYLVAAAAVAPPAEWQYTGVLATALALYVVCLTLVARREAGGPAGARRWLALALPLIALAPAAVVRPDAWLWPALTAAALVAWLLWAASSALVSPPRIKTAVGGWLAGICLIDAFYLALLDEPVLIVAALACFGATLAAHRAIPGT